MPHVPSQPTAYPPAAPSSPVLEYVLSLTTFTPSKSNCGPSRHFSPPHGSLRSSSYQSPRTTDTTILTPKQNDTALPTTHKARPQLSSAHSLPATVSVPRRTRFGPRVSWPPWATFRLTSTVSIAAPRPGAVCLGVKAIAPLTIQTRSTVPPGLTRPPASRHLGTVPSLISGQFSM